MSDIESISGKRALITGAGRRLGRAVAERLAAEGLDLVLHYRSAEAEAVELAGTLRMKGAKVHLAQADLADLEGIPDFMNRCLEEGPIDILINCASIFEESNFESFEPEAVHRNVDINALAPALLGRAFAAQGRSGAVINFLDTMARDYDKKHVAYHLSKRMFATLTRIMALELAPAIRVNAVAPGLALPPEGLDVSYLEELRHSNLLERYGSADGIVEAVVFLLRSGFITGQTIYVDGGRHLRGSIYE